MDWVKVGKLWYYLPNLTLEDKIRLGLDKEVVAELKQIQPEIKKNLAVEEKDKYFKKKKSKAKY